MGSKSTAWKSGKTKFPIGTEGVGSYIVGYHKLDRFIDTLDGSGFELILSSKLCHCLSLRLNEVLMISNRV